MEGICIWRNKALRAGFEKVSYGSLYISSYPTGQIGFLMCQKNGEQEMNQENVDLRFRNIEDAGLGTKYYQPGLQKRYVFVCRIGSQMFQKRD